MRITEREAILYLQAELEGTEKCIRSATDARALRVLKNSAEAFRMAIDAIKSQQPTNADRIRSMTDEELAVFLEKATGGCETCAADCTCNGPEDVPSKSVCHQGVLEWLREPVPATKPTTMSDEETQHSGLIEED